MPCYLIRMSAHIFHNVICHNLPLFTEEHNICTCRFCPSSNTGYLRGDFHFIWSFCTSMRRCSLIGFILQAVQAFTAEYLKTPLGEPVKGKKNKSSTELWLEKFYKKTTNLPEPFPHELVERLEKYLDVSLQNLNYCCMELSWPHFKNKIYFFVQIKIGSRGTTRRSIFPAIWSPVARCTLEQFWNSSEFHLYPAVSSPGLCFSQWLNFLSFFLIYPPGSLASNLITNVAIHLLYRYVDHVLISEKDKMRCCSIQYKLPVQSSQNYIYAGILLAGFFVYFVVIFFSSPVRWCNKVFKPKSCIYFQGGCKLIFLG